VHEAAVGPFLRRRTSDVVSVMRGKPPRPSIIVEAVFDPSATLAARLRCKAAWGAVRAR
jgi:hypothetical protein